MTPTEETAALVAEARRWAREFPAQVVHNDRERELARITAELIGRTADALERQSRELAAKDLACIKIGQQLLGARRDTERLDWLDSDDDQSLPDRYAEREFRHPEPAIWHVAHRNDTSYSAAKLRDAIDAARQNGGRA